MIYVWEFVMGSIGGQGCIRDNIGIEAAFDCVAIAIILVCVKEGGDICFG